MPITFLQFKTAVRSRVFVSGESRNLRPAHDKSIVDALIDLQRWVECLQNNNTHLVPHCATYFNCGLTSFDFPRSIIMRLSVIDKINPETGLEDPAADDDYCTEIEYDQVDPCHIRNFLGHTREVGCGGFSLAGYFAIPAGLCGNKTAVPIPTDEGVPAGLPALQLGYKYPQVSTDSTFGRAQSGVWAVENGRVLVAPWIQSTETVVLKWNGIKRDWFDADGIDDDPGLFRAVELFLRWEHARDWDRDANAASGYELEYRKALAELMYDCAEENRVRSCDSERGAGTGSSRGIAPVVKLYYNDQRQATEPCPPNQVGDPVTVVVPAETIASTISKGDANDKALAQAHELALAQLSCETPGVVYYNAAVLGKASCPAAHGDTPAAEGDDSVVRIEAGGSDHGGHGYTSSTAQDGENASQILATHRAQEAADDLAAAGLSCTFRNAPQDATATCPSPDTDVTAPGHVNASEFSLTSPTDCASVYCQAKVDEIAYKLALKLAADALVCPGTPPPPFFCSDALPTATKSFPCRNGTVICTKFVTIICPYGVGSGTSKILANQDRDARIDEELANLTQGGNCPCSTPDSTVIHMEALPQSICPTPPVPK